MRAEHRARMRYEPPDSSDVMSPDELAADAQWHAEERQFNVLLMHMPLPELTDAEAAQAEKMAADARELKAFVLAWVECERNKASREAASPAAAPGADAGQEEKRTPSPKPPVRSDAAKVRARREAPRVRPCEALTRARARGACGVRAQQTPPPRSARPLIMEARGSASASAPAEGGAGVAPVTAQAPRAPKAAGAQLRLALSLPALVVLVGMSASLGFALCALLAARAGGCSPRGLV